MARRLIPALTVTLCLIIWTSSGAAQSGADGSRPRPYPVVPSPNFQRAIQNGTRTTTGAPGPDYWQQWTNYDLLVRLEPDDKRIRGSVRLEYFNHAPDALDVVFLHLHQNVHAGGAVRNRPAEVTGGVTLERVLVNQTSLQEQTQYRVDGTVMAIRLPNPLTPEQSVRIEIEWTLLVPQNGLGRMGWSRDNLFFLAYWYPQMAVYDDVVGWHLDPYLGNAEFFAGFGNYELTVEAPEGWVIAATGELQNPENVYPAHVRDRLARATQSDEPVAIINDRDLERGTSTVSARDGKLTWNFRADSVRDVAFSATRESRWDAARTPVGDLDGDGRTDYARVDALYRATAPRWEHAARYARHSIDFLSRFTGLSYPWSHMTAVEGGDIIGGGMEFPMMTLIGDYNRSSDSALYYVTAHELGHMWVPMIVGVDERRRAWMDEGTTTFNENQARKEYFPGFNHDAPDQASYLSIAREGAEGELMRYTDYHYSDGARGIASYSKPATILAALRGLLGEETFLGAYRRYLRTWAFKHPKPWDFFNAFSSAAGRDLDWFWRTWYYETWSLDHAVGGVRESAEGTHITIEDRGLAPMPARITITRENGEILFREVPVDTWLSGMRTAEIVVPPGSPVLRVEIDGDGVFPDIDRANGVWRARGRR